ncbi:Heterokaryon incompatibility protein 6, OR allele [Colletotrichum tanaceti]|uniref:Heterokaryon incompatibility protein 6, OR allele n=1 Tax=Colletotrichum tanaceti TaxID=1306861 RepID=A0A4V6DHY7_9PEZI|nr:Heterokaryon incompatibility protein 6, OR allele [Colletotrichum tanaceti]TKW58386.1 Heterokaryon incompatibility protein 6, OR allele [Colletotrichum tanaceti]
MASVPPLPDQQSAVYFSYDDHARLSSASTHIRLIELYPPRHGGDTGPGSITDEDDARRSAADYSSPLRCSITTTPIATPRPYEALSYTWGPPDKSHSIDVVAGGGRRRLGITASLDAALRHLRRRDGPVTIWIDQICINQEDAAEKSDQVPLMAQIYSKADLVLVWLGPAADDSDALMDCWRDVGQAARDLDMEGYLTKERLPLLNRALLNHDPEDPATVRFQALLGRAVPVFDSLLRAIVAWNDRPWFGRVWTIQEQALGARTVFVCGAKTVDVDLVPLATMIFDKCIIRQDAENRADPGHIELMRAAQSHRFGSLMALRRRRRNFVKGEGPGDDLYQIMKKAYVNGDAQATLARDRIYGLLSVAVASEQLGITPDYASPECGPTFVEAARALIRAGHLQVLSFSQFPKDVDGLPSWVPDWRPTLTRSYLFTFEDVDGLPIRAAGDSTVEVVPAGDPSGVLGIRGLVVDVVEETGDVWDSDAGSESRLRALQTIQTLCDRSSGRGCEIYESGERRAEAAWRVPVGDLFWSREHGYRRAISSDGAYYEDCLAVLRILVEGFGPAVDGPEERQRRLEAFYELIPRQSVYCENMDKMTGMRPYVTRKGYLGMAPGGARPGDAVVIPLGSRIPYVLRPSGDGTTYEFVGEAYCDGVMDGEMLTKRRRETILIA